MHGPPGCGKTFLGRSVAGSASAAVPGLAYFEVAAPDLGSGPEAEQQLALLLESARSAAPALVLLDDLDALLGTGSDKKGGETHARRLSSRLCGLLDALPSTKTRRRGRRGRGGDVARGRRRGFEIKALRAL